MGEHDAPCGFYRFENTPKTISAAGNGKELKLTLKESELLELLMTRKQAVTSKDQMIEKLWGFDSDVEMDDAIEPDVTVRGNSEQLKQVMMILLDNAMKYTNPKGSIRIQLKKHHHVMVLSVANTGEGIAPEHLDRIFDRFYRTDASRARKHGGYGLGLAIAKAIVEQHKGKIFAKSVVKENTTFYVQIPLDRK